MNISTHVEGRGLVESPRWHGERLWFADWMAGEILTLNNHGDTQVMALAKAPPLSFDFSPDGRMLIVASGEQWLLRREESGEVKPFADLGGTEWNEIVVDGRGNAYINGAQLVLVTPDGKVQTQAEGFAFPNGMAITPDNSVLIMITAANWFGMERMGDMQGTGQVLSVPVQVRGAGWPLAATSVIS